MLTFRWKYKRLKQIEGLWNPWDIFRGLDPRLCMCQNGVRTKETEEDIADHVFSKEQLDLKALNVFFLNQQSKIYNFTLF